MTLSRIYSVTAAAIHLASRVVSVIAVLGMIFVMMIVVYNVGLREADQPPLRGIVEYVEIGMVITAFFALGEAERRRQHVSVNEVLEKLKGPLYTILRIGGGVAAAFIAILLAWAAFEVLSDSLARGEYKVGLVRVPMWPARTAVFIGFLILALEQVVTAIDDVIAHYKGDSTGEAIVDSL